MTSAYPMPSAPPLANARPVRLTFDRPVLAQIGLAVVPAMAATAAGHPSAAAIYLLTVLFA
jgi:hypothetical protein